MREFIVVVLGGLALFAIGFGLTAIAILWS